MTLKTPSCIFAAAVLLYTIVIAFVCPMLRKKDKKAGFSIGKAILGIKPIKRLIFSDKNTLDYIKAINPTIGKNHPRIIYEKIIQ